MKDEVKVKAEDIIKRISALTYTCDYERHKVRFQW